MYYTEDHLLKTEEWIAHFLVLLLLLVGRQTKEVWHYERKIARLTDDTVVSVKEKGTRP